MSKIIIFLIVVIILISFIGLPNFYQSNIPKIYKSTNNQFIIISSNAGFMNHSHILTEITDTSLLAKVRNNLKLSPEETPLFFKQDDTSIQYHNHNAIYFIIKNKLIIDSEINKITKYIVYYTTDEGITSFETKYTTTDFMHRHCINVIGNN